MATWNSRGLRGSTLEELINRTNERYSEMGLALIQKIPTPITPVKIDKEHRHITLAYFDKDFTLSQLPKIVFEGKSWKDIPPEKLTPRFRKIYDNPQKYHAPKFFRRFAYGEINGTITASAQPENCGITHPIENRRYTVREIARIQSFPDNYSFESIPLQSRYKVIGNAVPPILGWIVASTLINTIQK